MAGFMPAIVVSKENRCQIDFIDPWLRRKSESRPVDIPAVFDPSHGHRDLVVVDVVDDSIIADPNAIKVFRAF